MNVLGLWMKKRGNLFHFLMEQWHLSKGIQVTIFNSFIYFYCIIIEVTCSLAS